MKKMNKKTNRKIYIKKKNVCMKEEKKKVGKEQTNE